MAGLVFSQSAHLDWVSGDMDSRLVECLQCLADDFTLGISTIKTGHPMGAFSPGGKENDHFFYRAADVDTVNAIPLLDNPRLDEWIRLGRSIAALPPAIRPDRIYGPTEWHAALGIAPEFGFISDPFHDAIHIDHLHFGYARIT